MCIIIYVSKCVSESLASALDVLNSSNVSELGPRRLVALLQESDFFDCESHCKISMIRHSRVLLHLA